MDAGLWVQVDEFFRCRSCSKVFWVGPKSQSALEHITGMLSRLGVMVGSSAASGAPNEAQPLEPGQEIDTAAAGSMAGVQCVSSGGGAAGNSSACLPLGDCSLPEGSDAAAAAVLQPEVDCVGGEAAAPCPEQLQPKATLEQGRLSLGVVIP